MLGLEWAKPSFTSHVLWRFSASAAVKNYLIGRLYELRVFWIRFELEWYFARGPKNTCCYLQEVPAVSWTFFNPQP